MHILFESNALVFVKNKSLRLPPKITNELVAINLPVLICNPRNIRNRKVASQYSQIFRRI